MSGKRSRAGLAVAGVLIAGFAVGGAEAKDKVKVGFIGPLTGGVSANGLGGRNSADLAVRLRNADLYGQPGTAERVLARRAGAAVVARERDDVCSGLRDADGDHTDVRHDRHLHRDARTRIHGLDRKSVV